MHDPLNIIDLLGDELAERREDGYDVAGLERRVRDVVHHSAGADAEAMLRELEEARRVPGWPYEEPSDLDGILAALPEPPSLPPLDLDAEALRDRLHAAWLGRCAGCTLGKPVELWSRASIHRYLELAEAFPLDDYIPRLDPMPPGLALNGSWPHTTRGNVTAMPRDDDTDYTVLGLHVLECHGFDFGPRDVAREWLEHFPFLQVYTAERVAMRNLVAGLQPPQTAAYRNPYRQWIGAQIRADMWGYVSPGDPAAAARMAFADAALSHVQNGVYGEQWAAALIACAFVCGSAREALEASLSFVPGRSRLAEALRLVLDRHAAGVSWEAVRDELEGAYGDLSPVHTINNAAVTALALLAGEGDFARTVGRAVEGGWDTDCNGATAGSVFGALHGRAALPPRFVEPLSDRLRSALFGFDGSRISELAERTLVLALQRRGQALGGPDRPREERWISS